MHLFVFAFPLPFQRAVVKVQLCFQNVLFKMKYLGFGIALFRSCWQETYILAAALEVGLARNVLFSLLAVLYLRSQ